MNPPLCHVSARYGVTIFFPPGRADLRKLKTWREDLQEDLPSEDWEEICAEAQTQTANTHLKVIAQRAKRVIALSWYQ